MIFEEFKSNVEQWAKARGIYEHSTALAQALKAVSEVGELADAVIKDDKDALKDAIGDVAVCIVNAAKMIGASISLGEVTGLDRKNCDKTCAALCAYYVSDLATGIALGYELWSIEDAIECSFQYLTCLAEKSGLEFMDCCESAWLEIKDRTGKMVAGGAFVKDE